MAREIKFYFAPASPKWSIQIDTKVIAGLGSPFNDEMYRNILCNELTLNEGMYLEKMISGPQFSATKPVMMIVKPDNVFILKPGDTERQAIIGMILQHLVDRVEAGLIS